jgi:glycosyltransferase involved in cell wall biosynthesis
MCKVKLRILYVAYPLLPVTEHSAGGAEQVLWTLEREMHRREHQTTVAACAGSSIAGQLLSTGDPAESLDQFEARAQQQTSTVLEWLDSGAAANFDLLHDMSGAFWRHTYDLQLPVLATLHLPRSLYKQLDFSSIPVHVSFNCVSRSQITEFNDLPRMLGIARNGIALDRFSAPVSARNREYLLWLGRICEEKGTHTALDVAHGAGKKLIVAGAVYPFLYHQKYFAREVIPRLKRAGSKARYVERPSFAEKVELIRNAEALLVTSEINETSSIVAMEAAACGTPVVALDRGAMQEIIANGITGFLAKDAEEMRATVKRIEDIHALQCRKYAEENYSAERMADAYEEFYRKLLTCEKRG